MKELYNIDMEADGQFSKLVSDIPNPDIAISMGCNVGCPFIGRPFDDNWGLEDPTGKSDEEFKIVIQKIRKDILKLKNGFEEMKKKTRNMMFGLAAVFVLAVAGVAAYKVMH